MGACFFVSLESENWLFEFASVKTKHDTTLSRHNEVMFDLMVPLRALNIFANARIKFVWKRTVAFTHVEDV